MPLTNSPLALPDPARPVLIAGPTASGKSALALHIAAAQGRVIVNADALQVWDCWRILSARPDPADLGAAPHLLYGHKSPGDDYSVGQWLRDVAALLPRHPNPVIVGGTGLYLTALTEGLTDIPPTPPALRALADARIKAEGAPALLAEIDADTAARIDPLNPARIQRAWEVHRATGRGLADWHRGGMVPLLARSAVTTIRLDADRDWLNARIDARFDAMIAAGALDEVREVLPIWQPGALWAKAIGAPDLVAHLVGQCRLEDAISAAKQTSRLYAKRQRTWLRNRMANWDRRTMP